VSTHVITVPGVVGSRRVTRARTPPRQGGPVRPQLRPDRFEVEGESPILVLVTDWHEREEAFDDLLRWLRHNGQAALVLNLLDTSKGSVSLQRAEDVLAAELRELAKPVVLVGHGLGCVVIDHFYRTRLTTWVADKVKGVFLMAAPVVPPPWSLRRTVMAARLNAWLPGPITWPVRWWLAGQWEADGLGPHNPGRVAREAAAYVLLYGALLKGYETNRIPGPVWVSVHSDDTRSPASRARSWYLRGPGLEPAGYEKRAVYPIKDDRMPRSREATAELGAILKGFALYAGSLG
jgi:alpha-beta hydrolase superfamily lysophospholipase